MLQPEGDDVFDGIENLFPGSAKSFGGFLPGQFPRPARQKQHVGASQGAFAVAPRNFFHHDGFAAAAIHAPHGIHQKHQKAPERDELEAALGELVVSWSGLMATRTDRP